MNTVTIFYDIYGKTCQEVCYNSRIHLQLRQKQLQSESESDLLLVTRSNDNHSPGPVMREVSP